MAGGRPRTSTPPPEEMIQLGEEMISWLHANPNTLHLSQWYSIEKFIVDKVWRNMIEAPEFSPYYENALKIVGQKYLDKTSNVRDGISQRWQRVYFKDLRKQEDDDLDAQAQRDSKKIDDVSEDHQKKIDALLLQLSCMQELQRLQSERKMANNNISEEHKSDCDTED